MAASHSLVFMMMLGLGLTLPVQAEPLVEASLSPDVLSDVLLAQFTGTPGTPGTPVPTPTPPRTQPTPQGPGTPTLPGGILDPTRQSPAPLELPSTLDGGLLLVVGNWEAVPLAPSPSLVELSILGAVWPEPPYLISPPEDTTLISLPYIGDPVEPGGVDSGGLVEPGETETPEVNAPNIAASTTSLQNCQTQVRQIRETQASERTQVVYESLINCYQQNLEVAIATENTEWQAYSFNNLAVSYFVIGDYLGAIDLHQQQLETAQASGDRVQEGVALSGLGAAHAALGDYETALEFYTEGLPLIRLDAAPQWRAWTMRNVGNAHYALADYEAAKRFQQQSLELSASIGDRHGATQAWGNLANVYTVLGQYDEALGAYQQSLTLAQSSNDQLEMAQALLGLGTAYAHQQNYDVALGYYQQSVALNRQLGARLGEGIALSNVGEMLLKLDRLAEAEATLFEGVSVWESLRAGLGTHDRFKVSIFETQLTTYRTLQTVLVANNKVEKALEVAEWGRSRAFVELLARGQGRPIQDTAPLNIDQLKEVAIATQSTLVEYTIVRPQFAETPHGASVQSKDEVEESELLIWVIQPTGTVTLRQIDLATQLPDKSLAQLVSRARDRNRVGSRGEERGSRFSTDFDPTALSGDQQWQQLHRVLIEPIADLLPSDPDAPVIFIPQEQLFLVPFAALQNEQGQYLVERHTLLTAPAIQVVALTHQGQSTAPVSLDPNETLIVGNPTPMPAELSALPYTEVEAKEIAQLLAARPLLGSAATEAAIKSQLANARLIHFATHGLFNENQPLQGAIALVPGAQDGFLTAAEIMDFSLKAELVVLSACDTGRGRITGDGVIGLSRSFLAAGADSVLVSLWQVPDEATSHLMVEFYRELQQGHGQAQALRRAMLTTQETYERPGDWAAFTVMGGV